MIMSTTLGSDWRTFFDMVIANARKSYFWSEKQNPPMHVCDPSRFDHKGPIVEKGSDLIDLKITQTLTFLEGSARIIEELVAAMRPN